jgi:hypothetical protein
MTARSREIGWTAGGRGDDLGDLAEVVGPEDAGRHDRERGGVDVADVVEAVHGAARNAERVAGADVGRRAFDGPRQDTGEAVDRLLVAVVAVRHRHLRAGQGTSNSKTATAPFESPLSTRNLIASSPTLISSRIAVVMVLPPRAVDGKVT